MFSENTKRILSVLSIKSSIFVFAFGFFVLSGYIRPSFSERHESESQEKGNFPPNSKFFLNRRSNFYTLQGGLERGFLDILSHKSLDSDTSYNPQFLQDINSSRNTAYTLHLMGEFCGDFEHLNSDFKLLNAWCELIASYPRMPPHTRLTPNVLVCQLGGTNRC